MRASCAPPYVLGCPCTHVHTLCACTAWKCRLLLVPFWYSYVKESSLQTTLQRTAVTGARCTSRMYIDECLKTYTMVIAYALAIAASGLLARGGAPGSVLVRTGHVGTGMSPPTAIGWSPPHACRAPLRPISCNVQLGPLHQTARAARPMRSASLQLQILQGRAKLAMNAAAASPSPTPSR